jgi:chromosome segregation ATPase
MAVEDRPPSVGELVFRTGTKAGTRVPLSLPVTVIGRHSVCDVRLKARGVVDFHCLITITPAGPVLRSWKPEQTRLNDQPAAASLLKHGDHVQVGSCTFEFHWTATTDADPVAKREFPPDLLAQVAQARELFRYERERQEAEFAERTAELDRRADRVQKLRELAKAERTKARQVYRRYLKRMRTRWSAERKAIEAERVQLNRDQATHASQTERTEQDQSRKKIQLDEYKQRLYSAWQLLADNQKRLLTDRQQAEAWVARQTDLLDRRTRDLDEREQKLAENRTALESRVASLVAEIASLEARAMNTRAILRQLEDRRVIADTLAGTMAHAPENPLRVTLQTPTYHQPSDTQEIDRLLSDLHESNQAVNRERAKLMAVRADLDRQAEDLTDQRAVLVEQVAALAAARDLWQNNEHTTVVELEGLARAVRARELAVEDRERELNEAERERRKREYDLWQLRVRLEGWQAALAAQEATVAADRDRADAELNTKRELCTRWQASLEGIRQVWTTMRDQERSHLMSELNHLMGARERYVAAETEADRIRTEFLAEVQKLAARTLAVEQAHAADTRRMRVLRKRWEKHFTRFRKELDARKAALGVERSQLDDRMREMRRLSEEVFDRQTKQSNEQAVRDREELATSLVREEHSQALNLEKARRERGEQELTELRAEIDRLSRLLSESPPFFEGEPDVIPLTLRAA